MASVQKSWALMGVRTEDELVEFLEDRLWRDSMDVIRESETEVIEDTQKPMYREK